jgi:hypothetical protein
VALGARYEYRGGGHGYPVPTPRRIGNRSGAGMVGTGGGASTRDTTRGYCSLAGYIYIYIYIYIAYKY